MSEVRILEGIFNLEHVGFLPYHPLDDNDNEIKEVVWFYVTSNKKGGRIVKKPFHIGWIIGSKKNTKYVFCPNPTTNDKLKIFFTAETLFAISICVQALNNKQIKYNKRKDRIEKVEGLK